MRASALAEPAIATLLQALEEQPDQRWSERDIERMGLDLSTVRRAFKRHFGMTFLELARLRRLREGFEVLGGGGKVIEAQLEAGFESPSAFRAAFARLLGCSPGELKSGGVLQASWIPTPIGDMVAVSSKTHLHLLEFTDRKALPKELAKLAKDSNTKIGIGDTAPIQQVKAELNAFFDGSSATFETPIAMAGSPFAKSVWRALQEIPPGATRSYIDIARELGRPTASRAVARANGANQIALIIPCHRVIGSDGSLTGYGGGLWRKQRLLEIEAKYKNENARTQP